MLAVIREGLSNVARHAGAAAVTITITADARHVEVVIADDGAGIPADAVRSGLANLARRAGDLNGKFDAGPRDGGGTVVRWSVPLP